MCLQRLDKNNKEFDILIKQKYLNFQKKKAKLIN